MILNTEIFKRVDSNNIPQFFKVLKYSNSLDKMWRKVNILNPTLHETGIQIKAKFTGTNCNDLFNISSLYFLNVDLNCLAIFKKIIKLKALNYS